MASSSSNSSGAVYVDGAVAEQPKRPPEYSGPPVGVAVLGLGHRGKGLATRLCHSSGGKVSLVLYDELPAAAQRAKPLLASHLARARLNSAASSQAESGADSSKPRKESEDREEEEGVVVANSLLEAVRHPAVSWVIVSAINCLHKDYCLAALKAGRHVFCEKPLATTIDDCIAIKKAVVKASRMFMTGFVLRHSPFYSAIRSLVEERFVGKVVSMEANEMLDADHGGFIFRNWRRFKDKSGPHILEKCAHDIDILNWMAGSIVTSVAAFGGNDIFTPENKETARRLQEEGDERYEPLYESWGSYEDVDAFTCAKSVEDNLVAVLQYRNGIRATFQTNCCSALPQRQLKIFGVEGTLDGDSISGRLRARRVARGSELVEREYAGGQHAGGDAIQALELWTAMVHTGTHTGPVQVVQPSMSHTHTHTTHSSQKEGSSQTEHKTSTEGGGGKLDKAKVIKENKHSGATASVSVDAGFKLQSSLQECFISSITCLAVEEARLTGRVVDLEKYWKKLGV